MAAKPKKNFDADAYYKAMAEEKAKVIPLKDALEVTARQRAEDEAAGITIDPDPEPTPAP
jgi:uncharacterized protein (DUF934 family)